MTETHDPTHVLSAEEAWEFLGSRRFGRLAYHVASEVDIVPVNYVATGGRLVFQTAQGSKLFGVTVGKTVAFEVDEIGEDVAISVVARGIATHLTGDAADAAENLPLHAWVPTIKQEFVAIEVTQISGRRFDLDRSANDS